MSRTPPGEIHLPPKPTPSQIMQQGDSALSTDSPAESPSQHLQYSHTPSSSHYGHGQASVPLPRSRRRTSARQSFSTIGAGGVRRRVSRAATIGLEEMIGDEEVAPKLPTLVPGIRPAYSTPLPTLPMMVLCIAMLSELLSANLCTPFLLKMVEGFFLSDGKEKDSETEAQVGFWTGNLVSVFFITQFFTSLLWSSIADRHGRRAVIVASLAGSAMAVVVFGTSESLPEAICVRLVQGVFGGAVGVFRGSIRDITDDTNATRAYAILGFSWGFGGVVGPILGGVFESPAQNFPNLFISKIPLLQDFPYLLPTLIAGSILIMGSVMACFLSWDGGVRGGSRIALPIEKNEPLINNPSPGRITPGRNDIIRDHSPATSHLSAVPTLRNKRSDLLSPRNEEMAANGAGYPGIGTTGNGSMNPRRDSRASLGTAYGYGGIRSKHPTLAARAALEAARRVSHATIRGGGGQDDDMEDNEETPRLGLAQKLLLANEENTFNINDLWVSAAVAQDTAVFDDDETEEGDSAAQSDYDDDAIEVTPVPSPGMTPGQGIITDSEDRQSAVHRRMSRNRLVSGGPPTRTFGGTHRLSVSHGGRRFSTSSGTLPAIFSNTGLRDQPPALAVGYDESPGAAAQEQDPFFSSPSLSRTGTVAGVGGGGQGPIGGLSVISERPGQTMETTPLISPEIQMVNGALDKKESAWKSLPWLMISQYGLLALHNTTHDQLFLSFLVTPYKSGGLGLNPANFSFLIALMCLFQLLYQFWLYPRLGPPLGRFSHLQMFRLGCSLYVPAYLALPLLHSVASPDKQGGFVVMSFLTMITAVRYCGGTLAYTSIMVLINAMSPPHVVGLANGLAQSTVSFARFIGPVLGGGLWSASINGDPSGFFKGFIVVALGCAVQWTLSLLIR